MPSQPPRSSIARSRRAACASVVLLACIVFVPPAADGAAAKRTTPPATPTAPAPFSFDLSTVAARAEKLAQESFQAPTDQVPDWLRNITYDQWRDIRFRPEHTLWRDEKAPFQVQFFHPGFYYNQPVRVNVVDAKGTHPFEFAPSYFDYGRNDFASKVPQDLGFAGFRVHAAIKKMEYLDEVIVFLGASYFRALGRDQVFGLSARSLAVDTAESSGEEFPVFREFWLVTPKPDDREFTVYALLDSPSVAAAYRFVIKPGEQTTVAVDGRLFMRREVRKIGIGSLTSMFFHGENTARTFEDFRPEAHDSDGLLVNFASGEWLWRPIENPRVLNVSTLATAQPKGYGLVQRDRDFANYQDLETRYELRPSAWITPRGDWGKGRIELVEIPTKSDTNDNIVLYWVPELQPKPGTPYALAYTINWYGDDSERPPGGRVVATRHDRGTVEGAHRLVIDFAGKQLEALPADTVLRGAVSIASGPDSAELLDQNVVKNPVTGGWRLTFQVRPKGREPVELRAFLDKGGDTLTETWSYVILP